MNESNSKLTQLSWPDYALSGVASCLAAFSAGFGLGVPQVAYFFVIWVAVGTLFSAFIQRIIPKQVAGADGFVYALFGILAMVYARDLNNLLPSEGFVDSLRVAGWLCWMLVFGSFCMWRDSTVLFQAVPGIALFGLVGAWDTFRGAPFLFFGFLLCFATLFARAHARAMMVSAKESGFTSNALDQDKPGGFLRALRNGPWRWVAGPEWALGSALVVVLLSLLGAPAFQFALKGVSGFVRFTPPTARMQHAFYGPTPGSATNFTTGAVDSVGTGPHGDLKEIPIFRLKFPNPAYLRFHTYRDYNGSHSWQQVTALSAQDENLTRINIQGATRFHLSTFDLKYITGHYDSIPVPGDIERFDDGFQWKTLLRQDGTVANTAESTREFFAGLEEVRGAVRVPETRPVSIPNDISELDPYTDLTTVSISDRVRQLAANAAAKGKTDFEKAEAIRQAIASTATYDINAPAVPSGDEPVDYFLFTGKRGYCDLFATAMVILARSEGLPARYVSGYAPFTSPQKDKDGFYTYYDTDYHAWAEIYFKDVGWVPFDATDGAPEAPGAGRGSKGTGQPWYTQTPVVFGAASILGIALVGGIYYLLKDVRIGWILQPRKRSELDRLYVDLQRTMESRTGRPRRPSQTPYEYLEAIRPYLDGTYEPVQRATTQFVATFYGSAEPSAEGMSEVRKRISEAKAALNKLPKPKGTRLDSGFDESTGAGGSSA